MSATINDGVESAIADIRDGPNDWVLTGFEGKDKIRLIGTGTGGIESLKKNLVENDVCYGLVRTSHALETSGIVSTDFVKFVWIMWRPEAIPVMRKMKIGIFEGQIKRLFQPFHAELHASLSDEVDEGALASLLHKNTSRSTRSGGRTSNKNGSSPKPRRTLSPGPHFAKVKSFVPTGSQPNSNDSSIPPSQPKTVRANPSVAAKPDVEFDNLSALGDAIAAVRSGTNPTDWCLVEYRDKTTLEVVEEGTGGLDGFLDATMPSAVHYGLLKIPGKFDSSIREAFCFITWVPDDVPSTVKTRVQSHKPAVAEAFRKHQKFQCEFEVTRRSDISADAIRDRVRQHYGITGDKRWLTNGTENGSRRNSRASAPDDNHASRRHSSSFNGSGNGHSVRVKDGRDEAVKDEDEDDEHRLTRPKSFNASTGFNQSDEDFGGGENGLRSHNDFGSSNGYGSSSGNGYRRSNSFRRQNSYGDHESYRRRRSNDRESLEEGDDIDRCMSLVGREGKANGALMRQNSVPVEGSGGNNFHQTSARDRYATAGAPRRLEVDEGTTVEQAVERVRRNGDEADYIVVGWRERENDEKEEGEADEEESEDDESLELRELGTGGVRALAGCLGLDSIAYALVRMTEMVGASERVKYCCLRWAPGTVPAETRSKYGVLQGKVTRLFHPYHGDLTASEFYEVTPEAVRNRLSKIKQ